MIWKRVEQASFLYNSHLRCKQSNVTYEKKHVRICTSLYAKTGPKPPPSVGHCAHCSSRFFLTTVLLGTLGLIMVEDILGVNCKSNSSPA